MELRNKFNVGDEAYTVIRKPIQYDCPVCDGTGKFNHNGYNVKCPHCCGTGKLTDKKTLWNVVEEKVTIGSIRVNIHSNNGQSIKYKVYCKNVLYTINSRPESQLFLTIEEAEKFCYDGNNPIKSKTIKDYIADGVPFVINSMNERRETREGSIIFPNGWVASIVKPTNSPKQYTVAIFDYDGYLNLEILRKHFDNNDGVVICNTEDEVCKVLEYIKNL